MKGLQIIIEPLELSPEVRRAVAALIINPTLEGIAEFESDEPNPATAFSAPVPVAMPAPVAQAPVPVAMPAPVAQAPANVIEMPAAPVPPAAPVTTPNELDSAGLPWDERIHSTNKTKSDDGSWRRKRGVTDAVFAQVMSELKALMNVPAPPAAPVPLAVPAPPAAPVAAVPAPPAASANGEVTATRDGYVALITKASAAIASKKLTKDELDGVCGMLGVSSLPLLANRLDLVPAVYASLDALLAGK